MLYTCICYYKFVTNQTKTSLWKKINIDNEQILLASTQRIHVSSLDRFVRRVVRVACGTPHARSSHLAMIANCYQVNCFNALHCVYACIWC